MDASERDRLRELYSGWTTEELASAAALESCDYEREALELIMQELAARDDHAAPLLAAVGRAAWHRQGLAPGFALIRGFLITLRAGSRTGTG